MTLSRFLNDFSVYPGKMNCQSYKSEAQTPLDTEARVDAILRPHDYIVKLTIAMNVPSSLNTAVIGSVAAGYLKKANVNLLTLQRLS